MIERETKLEYPLGASEELARKWLIGITEQWLKSYPKKTVQDKCERRN